jgi:hypothetical protein
MRGRSFLSSPGGLGSPLASDSSFNESDLPANRASFNSLCSMNSENSNSEGGSLRGNALAADALLQRAPPAAAVAAAAAAPPHPAPGAPAAGGLDTRPTADQAAEQEPLQLGLGRSRSVDSGAALTSPPPSEMPSSLEEWKNRLAHER